MSPFSGASASVLPHAVGTWTMAGPTIAGFSVGNLGKRAHGTMPVTSATFEVTKDGHIRNVHAILDIGSIHTGIAKRDQDLRKRGLLDQDNYPQLTFTGTQVVAIEQGWTVVGMLTVKGTTREITLDVTEEDRSDGAVRLRLTGQLDRRHYGIKAPRLLIGALVDIEIDATFTR